MWYEKYLSIPFEANACTMKSCDCAGLIFLVAEKEIGLSVERPQEDDFSAKVKHHLFDKYRKYMEEVKREDVQEFDFFICLGRELLHAGVVVDSNTILDATMQHGVKLRKIESISDQKTRFYRVKNEARQKNKTNQV